MAQGFKTISNWHPNLGSGLNTYTDSEPSKKYREFSPSAVWCQGIHLTALGLSPPDQDGSQRKGRHAGNAATTNWSVCSHCHGWTSNGHQQGQAGARLKPSAARHHSASVPADAKGAKHRGRMAQSPALLGHYDPKERRQYDQPKASFPRQLDQKLGSYLRPDSRAGTSPSLCASVAILVNKLLSPPPR